MTPAAMPGKRPNFVVRRYAGIDSSRAMVKSCRGRPQIISARSPDVSIRLRRLSRAPPIFSARVTMDRPNPLPRELLLRPRKKRSATSLSSYSGMPGPVSSTKTVTPPSVTWEDQRIVPPCGIWRTAFSCRFRTARTRASRFVVTNVFYNPGSMVTSTPLSDGGRVSRTSCTTSPTCTDFIAASRPASSLAMVSNCRTSRLVRSTENTI